MVDKRGECSLDVSKCATQSHLGGCVASGYDRGPHVLVDRDGSPVYGQGDAYDRRAGIRVVYQDGANVDPIRIVLGEADRNGARYRDHRRVVDGNNVDYHRTRIRSDATCNAGITPIIGGDGQSLRPDVIEIGRVGPSGSIQSRQRRRNRCHGGGDGDGRRSIARDVDGRVEPGCHGIDGQRSTLIDCRRDNNVCQVGVRIGHVEVEQIERRILACGERRGHGDDGRIVVAFHGNRNRLGIDPRSAGARVALIVGRDLQKIGAGKIEVASILYARCKRVVDLCQPAGQGDSFRAVAANTARLKAIGDGVVYVHRAAVDRQRHHQFATGPLGNVDV